MARKITFENVFPFQDLAVLVAHHEGLTYEWLRSWGLVRGDSAPERLVNAELRQVAGGGGHA